MSGNSSYWAMAAYCLLFAVFMNVTGKERMIGTILFKLIPGGLAIWGIIDLLRG